MGFIKFTPVVLWCRPAAFTAAFHIKVGSVNVNGSLKNLSQIWQILIFFVDSADRLS